MEISIKKKNRKVFTPVWTKREVSWFGYPEAEPEADQEQGASMDSQ